MAGGWSIGSQWSSPQDLATSPPGLSGLTGGATAYTKGAWTQVSASTTADTAAIMFQVIKTGGNVTSAIDIGIGAAGSEIALVSNLLISNTAQIAVIYQMPLSIPAGSRLAMRMATEGTSQNVYYRVSLFDDTSLSTAAGSAIDTYGFNSATNNGATIVGGGAAKGAYTELTASATADLAGFLLAFDSQGHTTAANGGDIVFDIAIGAAGAEQVILPNTWNYLTAGTNVAQLQYMNTSFIPIQIPAGSRIAARAQTAISTSPDNNFGLTLYGVRQ